MACGTVCAALLAAVGCASTGGSRVDGEDGFHARGRLAVGDRDEGFTASFDWRQQGGRYDIDLWGPLGQGRLHVSGNEAALTVADARGNVVASGAGAALLGERFGWSLPLGALRHWLVGRCDPAVPPGERRYDDAGLLAGFDQHGWQVRLAEWRQADEGPRPGRLVATQGARRIAVAIREWR